MERVKELGSKKHVVSMVLPEFFETTFGIHDNTLLFMLSGTLMFMPNLIYNIAFTHDTLQDEIKEEKEDEYEDVIAESFLHMHTWYVLFLCN